MFISCRNEFLQRVASLLGGNITDWSQWDEKQAGGIFSFHRSEKIQSERETERYLGLHKNTSHAYSQDVLSFMLGREGKSVYTGNKKKKK